MKRYFYAIAIIFNIWLIGKNLSAQPQIGVYPPQVHQQICQESTFTRYLDLINYGKDTLEWNAIFPPGPYDWVTASPAEGKVNPNDTSQIVFVFNSAGLTIENYFANLQINSNDPVHPDTIVLAMLHVQQMDIFIEPENDSICYGCNTTLHTMVFGCSEVRQYEWTSDPPGFYSQETNPVVAPELNTLYRLKVTDGGGIAHDSIFIKVFGSSAIDEPSPAHVRIYPNPSLERVSMLIHSKSEDTWMVKIIDLYGKQVCQKKIEVVRGSNHYLIVNDDLSPGIYLLKIDTITGAEVHLHPWIKLIII